MLRDELYFHERMRASLKGIEDLDPAAIGPRIADLDRTIAALRERIAAEEGAAPPKAATVRAA